MMAMHIEPNTSILCSLRSLRLLLVRLFCLVLCPSRLLAEPEPEPEPELDAQVETGANRKDRS